MENKNPHINHRKRLYALTEKIGIKFIVADDPLHAVAKGTGIALKNINRFSFLIR